MHGASFLLQTNTHRDVSNVSRSKDREGGKGMVVLVTGASRGIGRTLAAARERHDVVVYCLKNAAQANALVSELAYRPRRVIAIQADVNCRRIAYRGMLGPRPRSGQQKPHMGQSGMDVDA